jgi:hypothetical protein
MAVSSYHGFRRVWKWMALAAYGFLLYIFLTICVSNYEHTST